MNDITLGDQAACHMQTACPSLTIVIVHVASIFARKLALKSKSFSKKLLVVEPH